MLQTRPDARARGVHQRVGAQSPPDDPDERALYEIMQDRAVDEAYAPLEVAWELARGPEHHVLDALLIARVPDEAICEALQVPAETVKHYRSFFFDVTVFRHVFAARRYVKSLPNDGSEEYKSYDLALNEGGDNLLNRYRLGDAPLPDMSVLQGRMIVELASRAREHRGVPLTNRKSVESLRCATKAMDGASARATATAKAGSSGASSERALIMALVSMEHTVKADALGVNVNDIVQTGPVPPAPGTT